VLIIAVPFVRCRFALDFNNVQLDFVRKVSVAPTAGTEQRLQRESVTRCTSLEDMLFRLNEQWDDKASGTEER